MLTQAEADTLIGLPKRLESAGPIRIVMPGDKSTLVANSDDGRERFLMDLNRGRIRLSKYTCQERYRQTEVLVRLDVDGPPHQNPDGEVIPTPHIHMYREGYGSKWAHAITASDFSDITDIAQTLRDFLTYCNVGNIPQIQAGLQ